MAGGETPHDDLVAATGCTRPRVWDDCGLALAPGLKTLGDGLDTRERVPLAFEPAERGRGPAVQGRLFVQVFMLMGFRNRLSVMTQWAYSYLTCQRAHRLITGDRHRGGRDDA